MEQWIVHRTVLVFLIIITSTYGQDGDENCTDKDPLCTQLMPPCDNDGLMIQKCPKTCNACSTLLPTTYFKEDGSECQYPFHIDCDKGYFRQKCPVICSSIDIGVIPTQASVDRPDFVSKVTFSGSQHKESPVTQNQEYLTDIRMTTESSSENADTSDGDENCTDKEPECTQLILPCDGLMIQICPKTCNACSTLLTTTYFKEDGKECQNLFHIDCDKGDFRKKCPVLCSSIAISVISTQAFMERPESMSTYYDSTILKSSHSNKEIPSETVSTTVTTSHSKKNGLTKTYLFSTILTSSYSKTYILTETGSSSATEPESTNSREDIERTSWFVAIIIVAVVIITATYAVKKKPGCGLNCIRLRIHSAHVRARCYRDSSVYQMVEMESGTQQFFLQDPSIHLYRYRDVQADFETQTDCHDQQKSDVLSLLRSRFASTYKIMSSTSDSGCQPSSADKLQQGHGKCLLPIRKVFDRIVPQKSLPGENVQINDKERQQLARARGPSEESMNQDGLVYANLDFSHLHMTDFRPPTAMEPTEYAAIDFQKCAKKIKD